MQHGLVPKRPSAPPQGATTGRDSTLTKWIDTRPCATAISAQWPMRPRWCALASATMQLPRLPGARDAQLHRLLADHLAVAALAVERQQAAAVERRS